MPRNPRPANRRRHSRAHVRFHRDRVVGARAVAYRAVLPDAGDQRFELGQLEDEQLLGCRRARCGVCHPGKRWHRGGDRLEVERRWRHLEQQAW